MNIPPHYVKIGDGEYSDPSRVKMKTAKQHNATLVGASEITPQAGEYFKQAVAKRLRQRAKPLLNKLETEFKARLQFLYHGQIVDQGIRFRLANGIHYTPDFTRFDKDAPHFTAYEVKGFMRDDAAAKLKMAAHLYPQITWILVWKKDGQWCEQTVLA